MVARVMRATLRTKRLDRQCAGVVFFPICVAVIRYFDGSNLKEKGF